ncbi:DNA-binding LytR/AlgR family response regulator [Algoriphagus sp. 4150]|uniref:LytR/AlgR family response regulator transcription factor n=1 Tax=Algoriphagus sp. 4150 TaxID=2817756 RepID=UPI0028635C58|nr:LytTR family DNA-binding domain-containing protein [Algoriphagus sp. 4150]MDR7128037.1 DNA-binding LytR/AlgR family response regulator [Algoriphagus sp. 4150]
MNILIIEDEQKAAKELERILLEIDGKLSVVAILDSVEQGVSYLSKEPPVDLIFSDIQLADGMCFEIYNQVTISSPIIFCTAFDEYMMEAFDTNAVSYLLKPVTSEKGATALAQYHQMKTAFEPANAARTLGQISSQLTKVFKSTILVEYKEKIIPLRVKDIAYFYLDKTIVKITTRTNQRFFFASSLDEVERVLDPELFYRANRQFLINKQFVVSIERHFSRKLVTKLSVDTPEAIVVSKAKASEFLRWIEGLNN